MHMNKHHGKPREKKFWKRARAICNLHSYYNFAIVLHKNALFFGQWEAGNFFMYIIKPSIPTNK